LITGFPDWVVLVGGFLAGAEVIIQFYDVSYIKV